MKRRQFLAGISTAAVAAAFPSRTLSGTVRPPLRVFLDRPLATMPADFAGFSYENAQLADPTYFSASNQALVAQFRKLSGRGVLRLGGNLSDLTLWSGGTKSDAAASIPPGSKIETRFEWRNVGTNAGRNRPATITPESIRALGSFLKATEWSLIYGLNLGTGTPERAAEEAACVAENAGNSLLAFQVGNEPDLFRGSLRGRGWNFNRYWDEYQDYVRAVRARTPQAPFAGPDVADNTSWARQFAERAVKDAVLLTSHYYAMGPPENADMNAKHLLRRDRRLLREIPVLVATAKASGMPYRMAEGNSCFHGGKPGVSDAFASALWVADYLLLLAQGGCAGVNLHTGGEGFYAAFVGEKSSVTERPLFYGMEFAQRFAGATFIATNLETGGGNVTAYVARRGKEILLAIVNKDSVPVSIQLTGVSSPAPRLKESWTLAAPALDARAETRFQPDQPHDPASTLQAAEYSARLVVLDL